MDGTPCTIQTEPDRHGINYALRIVDRDGNEVASCFYSEGNTQPIEVIEKWAHDIAKAVNMHDRLVAYLADNLPKCSYRCARNYSCDGCQCMCEEGALLKEAKAAQS